MVRGLLLALAYVVSGCDRECEDAERRRDVIGDEELVFGDIVIEGDPPPSASFSIDEEWDFAMSVVFTKEVASAEASRVTVDLFVPGIRPGVEGTFVLESLATSTGARPVVCACLDNGAFRLRDGPLGCAPLCPGIGLYDREYGVDCGPTMDDTDPEPALDEISPCAPLEGEIEVRQFHADCRDRVGGRDCAITADVSLRASAREGLRFSADLVATAGDVWQSYPCDPP